MGRERDVASGNCAWSSWPTSVMSGMLSPHLPVACEHSNVWHLMSPWLPCEWLRYAKPVTVTPTVHVVTIFKVNGWHEFSINFIATDVTLID
jgi:hypothetical protein